VYTSVLMYKLLGNYKQAIRRQCPNPIKKWKLYDKDVCEENT